MGWLQRVVGAGRIVACSALLASCAQIHNEPINQPLVPGAGPSLAELGNDVGTYYDDTVVALSFSGGGTRAAAFSYGVLTALDQTPMPNRPTSLLDRVDFVTGVSGGSVLAAYYGLKKRKALADFKQRFLLRNAQAELDTSTQPDQHRQGPARRHQRSKQLFALARRQSVRTRDVQKPDASAAPADLDQCLRHL